MYVLVCNAGSTSLKFKLFAMPAEEELAAGKVERVGTGSAIFHYDAPGREAVRLDGLDIPTYTAGIALFLQYLTQGESGVIGSVEEIERVGFKTVLSKGHYGVHELTQDVLQGMEDYMVVAPAHNKPYLEAIRQFQAILPSAAMVGAFETAFHTTIPIERRLYGIPYEWYETYGIQKLGYHGASHSYVADCIAAQRGTTGRLISCHLGGSGSLCAISDGRSVDNSFGFSLQAGVLHANRIGDTDAYIIPFLLSQGMPLEEILRGMDKRGGLLGISGVSNDLRDVEEAAAQGNARAKIATDAYCNSVVRYIGAYYAELGGMDHLAFTGGIGENGAAMRREICAQVAHMGVLLDEEKNAARSAQLRVISQPDSPVTVWVIPANEELGVARKTYACGVAKGK